MYTNRMHNFQRSKDRQWNKGKKWKTKCHFITAILNQLSSKKSGIGSIFYEAAVYGGKNFCDSRSHDRHGK